MQENDIKIYCKFDKTKQPIEEIICQMFCDYTEDKNMQKNNSHNGENENITLK